MPPFAFDRPVNFRFTCGQLKKRSIRFAECLPCVVVTIDDRARTSTDKPVAPQTKAIGLEIPMNPMGPKPMQ